MSLLKTRSEVGDLLARNYKPDLLRHTHEVEIIPGVNNLSLVDPNDCNAGKFAGD